MYKAEVLVTKRSMVGWDTYTKAETHSLIEESLEELERKIKAFEREPSYGDFGLCLSETQVETKVFKITKKGKIKEIK